VGGGGVGVGGLDVAHLAGGGEWQGAWHPLRSAERFSMRHN